MAFEQAPLNILKALRWKVCNENECTCRPALSKVIIVLSLSIEINNETHILIHLRQFLTSLQLKSFSCTLWTYVICDVNEDSRTWQGHYCVITVIRNEQWDRDNQPEAITKALIHCFKGTPRAYLLEFLRKCQKNKRPPVLSVSNLRQYRSLMQSKTRLEVASPEGWDCKLCLSIKPIFASFEPSPL